MKTVIAYLILLPVYLMFFAVMALFSGVICLVGWACKALEEPRR